MLTLLLFIRKFLLSPEINKFTYCSGVDREDVSVYLPYGEKVIVVFTRLKGIENVYLSSLSKTTKVTNPALLFPEANAMIHAAMEPGECMSFDYAVLPKTACDDGIHVISSKNFSYFIDSSERNLDKCVFFASPDKNTYKLLDVNLNKDRLITFHEVINTVGYDYITGNRSVGNTPYMERPWIFRLETFLQNEPSVGATIVGNVTSTDGTILEYEGAPDLYTWSVTSSQKIKWYIPVIGSIAPIILIVSSVYTFFTLYRKPPVQQYE